MERTVGGAVDGGRLCEVWWGLYIRQRLAMEDLSVEAGCTRVMAVCVAKDSMPFLLTSPTMCFPLMNASKPHTAALSSNGKIYFASIGTWLWFVYVWKTMTWATKSITLPLMWTLSRGTGFADASWRPALMFVKGLMSGNWKSTSYKHNVSFRTSMAPSSSLASLLLALLLRHYTSAEMDK